MIPKDKELNVIDLIDSTEYELNTMQILINELIQNKFEPYLRNVQEKTLTKMQTYEIINNFLYVHIMLNILLDKIIEKREEINSIRKDIE